MTSLPVIIGLTPQILELKWQEIIYDLAIFIITVQPTNTIISHSLIWNKVYCVFLQNKFNFYTISELIQSLVTRELRHNRAGHGGKIHIVVIVMAIPHLYHVAELAPISGNPQQVKVFEEEK